MANLIYRSTASLNVAGNANKGSALTVAEADGNILGLQTDINLRALKNGDTFSGNVIVSGTGTAQLNTTGDIWSYRTGGTTGALYLNNTQSRGLVNDGTNYQLPSQGLVVGGIVQGTSFSGAGTGLTGTAGSLSIGGVATTATNLSGGYVSGTTCVFSSTFSVTGTSSHIGNAAFTGGISLIGATSNLIDFGIAGSAPPTLTTRSLGTKIVLYPNLSGIAVDFAIGLEPNSVWSSVAVNTQSFKWYGGTTLAATLTGLGALSLTASLTTPTIAVATSIGLASENLITQKTTTTAATTPVSIMDISGVAGTGYRSVDFIVQAVDTTGGKFHTAKLLVVHNGATADYTEYGTINVGGACGIFSVAFAAGTLSLMVTPSTTNSTIFKVFATATHI